jgi:hypothetical protein
MSRVNVSFDMKLYSRFKVIEYKTVLIHKLGSPFAEKEKLVYSRSSKLVNTHNRRGITSRRTHLETIDKGSIGIRSFKRGLLNAHKLLALFGIILTTSSRCPNSKQLVETAFRMKSLRNNFIFSPLFCRSPM